MRYLILVAALSALALSACDRQTTVAPSPPVVVVPGPAGPQGAPGMQGAPAEKGATGATGATGSDGAKGDQGKQGQTGGDTIVVIPAPEPKR